MRRRAGLASLVLVLAAACGGPTLGGPGASPARPPALELTVLAAASLRDAFTAAGEAYRDRTPTVTLTFSFDASSALRAQIEQGAPADVFASADTISPEALAGAGLARGSVVVFARNKLAIVVPDANPAAIREPRDLARPGVRIVGAGEAVPISHYVATCLDRLAALPGYPGGYAEAVLANVVSREDNVRAALAKVELGEADAAIVYATDAASADVVTEIPVPPAANVDATYGAIVVAASRQPTEATAFVDWLAGEDGTAVLARFGFLGPGGE